jgi:hypothetical protein
MYSISDPWRNDKQGIIFRASSATWDKLQRDE